MENLKALGREIREEMKTEGVGQKVAPQEKVEPELKEGKCKGIVKNATYLDNISTKNGMTQAVDVEYKFFEDTELVVPIIHDLTERYFISKSNYSKYAVQIGELLGRNPVDSGFNTSELKGIGVEVQIKHNIHETGTYANIDSLRKINLDLE